MDFGLGVANTLHRRRRGRRGDPDDRHRDRRAGRQHARWRRPSSRCSTMYGMDTGIRTERFFDLSKLVMELAGVSQPSNRPVVGERLYNVESGIISTWVRNVGDELTESFPYRPELVGQPAPVARARQGIGARLGRRRRSNASGAPRTPEQTAGDPRRGEGALARDQGSGRRRRRSSRSSRL